MDETFRIFASIAMAIVLEAMPFLAVGSLLSAIVEVFVSPARIARVTPRGRLGRVTLGLGVERRYRFVPVCSGPHHEAVIA